MIQYRTPIDGPMEWGYKGGGARSGRYTARAFPSEFQIV